MLLRDKDIANQLLETMLYDKSSALFDNNNSNSIRNEKDKKKNGVVNAKTPLL